MPDRAAPPAPVAEAPPTGRAASAPLETVALSAYERVVARGVERQTWLVCAESQWQNPRSLDGVEVTAVDARPGTVWESVATVPIARGAWVKRIVKRPGAAVRRDPMAYLQREQLHPPQATAVRYYRVGRRGLLVPSPPPDGTLPTNGKGSRR